MQLYYVHTKQWIIIAVLCKRTLIVIFNKDEFYDSIYSTTVSDNLETMENNKKKILILHHR
jgi:hypothetical protein